MLRRGRTYKNLKFLKSGLMHIVRLMDRGSHVTIGLRIEKAPLCLAVLMQAEEPRCLCLELPLDVQSIDRCNLCIFP